MVDLQCRSGRVDIVAGPVGQLPRHVAWTIEAIRAKAARVGITRSVIKQPYDG